MSFTESDSESEFTIDVSGPDMNGYYSHYRNYSTAQTCLDRGEAWRIERLHVAPERMSRALFERLQNLTHLTVMSRSRNDVLPLIAHLSETLESLVIRSDTSAVRVPVEIAQCRKLSHLTVIGPNGTHIPMEIASLPQLGVIYGWMQYPDGSTGMHDFAALRTAWKRYVANVVAVLNRPDRLYADLVAVVVAYL